jgi:predicted nucleotidyltransferase
MNPQELLTQIKKTIASEYPASEIILFGSRARNEEHRFSDWDILIVVDENLSEQEKIAIHDKVFDIELTTGETINTIIHTRQEWDHPRMQITPFYQHVKKEGIVL